MKSAQFVPVAVACSLLFGAAPVFAADVVVVPPDVTTAGGHEVWAHSEMGQSFKAQASSAKGGFYVWYSPESAALGAPNAPVTDMTVSVYAGETLDPAQRLHSAVVHTDSQANGFMDVDFAAAGITFVPGNTYTIGVSSQDRGWIVPSVCDFTTIQPTGAYADGHPFFQGAITVNETGICDNAFHMVDTGVVSPTPTPTVSPTPTPDYTVTTKKMEFNGTILAVQHNVLTVGKYTVYITPTTKVNYNYAPGFMTGQRVHVKGWKNSNGTVTAAFVEVRI